MKKEEKIHSDLAKEPWTTNTCFFGLVHLGGLGGLDHVPRGGEQTVTQYTETFGATTYLQAMSSRPRSSSSVPPPQGEKGRATSHQEQDKSGHDYPSLAEHIAGMEDRHPAGPVDRVRVQEMSQGGG